MAYLAYLAGLCLAGALLTPLMPWFDSHLATSHLGFVLLFCIIFTVPALLSSWAAARLVPRWCLVPWATVSTSFFLIYILPQLQKMWQTGDWWQFWQLTIGFCVAFIVHTWVVFTTRRRVIHRLSTSCG